MTVYKTILGNIKSLKNTSHLHLEKVFLNSDDLAKKLIVAKTDHGNEIGMQLAGEKFSDGDILFQDEHNLVYIVLEGTDVLVIRPKTMKEMGVVAHNLGNRHMPAQFDHLVMVVPYDYLVEDYLKELGVSYARESRKLKEAFRHVDGAH